MRIRTVLSISLNELWASPFEDLCPRRGHYWMYPELKQRKVMLHAKQCPTGEPHMLQPWGKSGFKINHSGKEYSPSKCSINLFKTGKSPKYDSNSSRTSVQISFNFFEFSPLSNNLAASTNIDKRSAT